MNIERVDIMSDVKNCCPLCSGEFTPTDGTNPADHLAKGILSVYRELQIKADNEGCADNLPCARCGNMRMDRKISRNALSRSIEVTITICDICGVEESVLIYAGIPKPLSEWIIVKEILSTKKY
jgi:hypothetical protein